MILPTCPNTSHPASTDPSGDKFQAYLTICAGIIILISTIALAFIEHRVHQTNR